ncbi:LAETG motif-containing sortase-dependent surface protein [Actinoplanes sp. NPDC020271]|uniref:LAETG motif-containing sortase-dependent surface protein n=1 Tax=Actinoplanes sp. NPDC020271 TaxID=3363896 RepID=UPI0037B4AB96
MKFTPRLRHVAALAAGALVSLGSLVAFSAPAQATNNACVPAANAKFEHSFNGPAGTAGIKLVNGPLCENVKVPLTLVSYTAPSASFSLPQYVLDSSTQFFTADTPKNDKGELRLDFKVKVPTCFTQVDFVFGDDVINPLTDKSDRYNDRKVGSPAAPGSQSKPERGQPQNAWWNGNAGDYKNGVCAAKPAVEALPDCEGNVKLSLINRDASVTSVRFEITADGGFKQSQVVDKNAKFDLTIPAANAKNIKVTAGGNQLWSGSWVKPAECTKPEVGAPVTEIKSTCDSLVFTLKNPENGAESLTGTFTPDKGAAQTVTVKAGETKTVTFPAAEGLTVAVTGDFLALNGDVKWTKPENCTTNPNPGPSTSASVTPSATTSATASVPASASASETPAEATPATSSTEGGALALTGSNSSTIAGGAVLLLLVGAGLFFLARRRRVNFKA